MLASLGYFNHPDFLNDPNLSRSLHHGMGDLGQLPLGRLQIVQELFQQASDRPVDLAI
ncbi:MAG: hypothetical protein ACO34J_09335 [Prochlorothrix sp.]